MYGMMYYLQTLKDVSSRLTSHQKQIISALIMKVQLQITKAWKEEELLLRFIQIS